MTRACLLALLAACVPACSNTHDIYVGSDVPGAGASADPGQAGAAGAPSTPSAQDAGQATSAGQAGVASVPPARDAGQAGAPSVPPAQDAGPVAGADAGRLALCAADRADCDGDARNGCEVATDSDLANCGGCGRSCNANGQGAASAACLAGTCQLTCQFPQLLGNCDGNPDNGCETDLFHDPANCGSCGMRCNGCVDARCL